MYKDCPNVYKKARKDAFLTIEKASYLLNVSESTLKNYEKGTTIPNDDVVLAMINIYKSNWLGYEHIRSSTEIGRRYLPKIDTNDLARNVLRFQKEVNDLDTVKGEMIEIACDGVVDNSEKASWDRVTIEVKEAVGAGMALLFTI